MGGFPRQSRRHLGHVGLYRFIAGDVARGRGWTDALASVRGGAVVTTQPRLMSGPDAAAYLGLTSAAFHRWVAEGRIPKPLPGTRRWDRKAIDHALDKASAIPSSSVESEPDDPFLEWKRTNEARQQAAAEAGGRH